MTRPPPVWPYALAVSLLLHAALLLPLLDDASPGVETTAPPPLEARLIRLTPPAPPPVAVRAVRPPPLRPAAVPVIDAEAGPTPDVESAETGDAVVTEAAGEAASVEAELPHPAVPEMVVEPAAPTLAPLPPRIDMRFQVRYGLARGEQTLVWVNEGDTYTVTSVAAATGLVGVFYSGRFVQTSRGRITPQGLVPELFWDQRGDKRSSARFDAVSGMLSYSPAQGATRQYPFRGEAQDTLSLFFQLALTAPPERSLHYLVFNGRRLRDYAYEVRGEAVLDTALGPLRTLHLARTGQTDGRFEVWLAIDRHHLPVRVLRTDDKGSEVELTIVSISP